MMMIGVVLRSPRGPFPSKTIRFLVAEAASAYTGDIDTDQTHAGMRCLIRFRVR